MKDVLTMTYNLLYIYIKIEHLICSGSSKSKSPNVEEDDFPISRKVWWVSKGGDLCVFWLEQIDKITI